MDFWKDIEFVQIIEQMKKTYRMTKVVGTDRRENDAEHSWHVAIMSMILESHSKIKVDVNRVIKMLLIHDLVEIYAGDTFAYDVSGNLVKHEKELKAMERIKSELSSEMGAFIEELWLEFEKKETNESKYANSMDRLQPILANFADGKGGTWKDNKVTIDQVLKRIEPIKYFNDEVYEYVVIKLKEAVKIGFLIG